MSGREEDDDCDAPEEFTAEQGMQQDEQIRKIHRLNTARISREKKERRKKQVERLTPRPPKPQAIAPEVDDEMVENEAGVDEARQSQLNTGMLPNDIVDFLAAREKQVFLSDSDEEKIVKKLKPKKKKIKNSGVETVILNEIPPTPCVQSSLEFLKKRKMQFARSPAVLNNSNQALRLLSSSGLLK